MKLFKISFFVLGVHAAAIFWLAKAKERVNPPPMRLIAQTVTFAEEAASEKPASIEAPKPKPKPKPAPPKKVEEKKEKKVEEKKEKLIKDPSLVAKAKESIAKINKTSDKTNTGDSVKKEKGKPQSAPQKLVNYEEGYREELGNRLKLLLRLPEYGVVQVKLTVSRRGLVKKVEIVSSESEVNERYIEKALPELAFPPFGNNFPGEADHTFLISLNNEL